MSNETTGPTMAAYPQDAPDDERIDAILKNGRWLDGFANNAVMWTELRAMAQEIKYFRERPSHCPSCDGDHG